MMTGSKNDVITVLSVIKGSRHKMTWYNNDVITVVYVIKGKRINVPCENT